MSSDRTVVKQSAPDRPPPRPVAVPAQPALAATTAGQALQRRMGNQAVQALFAPATQSKAATAPAVQRAVGRPEIQRSVTATAPANTVQTRLHVSSPSDREELEAQSTGKKIARMADPGADAVASAGSQPGVYRKGDGPAKASSEVSAEIRGSLSSGSPLPGPVRSFMEPRFRADFSQVRIHTDGQAASLSRKLSAQAFTYGRDIFFGKDQYQPDTQDGRELIAHELTHTIQQGGAVQRSESPPAVTQRSAPQVQRLGISDALDYFADKAYLIPGFRMFTLILGVNPINMGRVERNAANILRALVEFLPGGILVTQALDNYGVFDRVGAWVDQQFNSLGMTVGVIRAAIDRFLDSLHWRDILHLGDVWERAKGIFLEPINRILAFARNLANGVIQFIKDAILMPLARLAANTPGWDLLCAVLGRNPITGEAVARNAETLIGGFMRLIGQQEVWENIKRGNAVARAWAWFQGALAGLLGFVQQIPSLFLQALRSLEIIDLVLLPRAFVRVATVFAGFAGRFVSWAGRQVLSLLEIIFEVVAPAVMPYLRRAGGALQSIFRNPVGFLGNLVRAGIQGFRQFAGNFLTHLRTSLIGWLTGTLSSANVYIPQAFNLREILKFVLSVLGLTWQNIRGKLVRVIGETAVGALETGFDIVVTLVRDGPAAAWEKIAESVGNLRDMVIEQIMAFVRNNIVQAAITRLLTSLNPVGAFIQAVIAIYNTVMFFVERLRQIAQVAMAFIDSMAAIASGAIGAAANRVEQTMAGLLTLVISFLARIVGLGNVAQVVTNLIDRVRQPIDRALDRVVEWVVGMARRLGKVVVQAGRRVVSALVDWVTIRKAFQLPDGTSHTIFTEVQDAPTVIIQSRRKTFAEYLSGLVFPVSDNAKIQAKRRASAIFGRIVTGLTRLKSREASFGSTPTASERGELRKMGDDIREEYIGLSEEVKIMGVGNARSETVLTRIEPTSGSKLTSLEAKPLTALRGNTVGNPNANRVSGVPGWSFLDQIDNSRGNDGTIYNEWVRWHLIHSSMHGPASVFNLVAAPRSQNTRFAGQVESPVLRSLLEPGKVLFYKVAIVYGNAATPLNDFPTSISYTWGTMKERDGGGYVEDQHLGSQTYSGFPLPTLRSGSGPVTITLKALGAPAMRTRAGLSTRVARRVALAVAAYPSLGVLQAMDSFYPAGKDEGKPIVQFLAADKDAIAAAQRRLAGIAILDLG